MDPYLERFWNDVHGPLIADIRADLNDHLPSRYRATMQERVVITDLEEPVSGARFPDVAILEAPHLAGGGVATLSSRGLIRAPALISVPEEPITEYSIEIVDARFGQKVITAIEVLSPENKRIGDGMAQFQRKQREYRAAGVSRVEIDLLREGRRLFNFPALSLGPQLQKPYYVTVCRGWKPGECEVYAIDLREPLPVINIPLRSEDVDVQLDLQPLMEHVYRTGRFPIDYNEPCDPPLDPELAGWARECVEQNKIQ